MLKKIAALLIAVLTIAAACSGCGVQTETVKELPDGYYKIGGADGYVAAYMRLDGRLTVTDADGNIRYDDAKLKYASSCFCIDGKESFTLTAPVLTENPKYTLTALPDNMLYLDEGEYTMTAIAAERAPASIGSSDFAAEEMEEATEEAVVEPETAEESETPETTVIEENTLRTGKINIYEVNVREEPSTSGAVVRTITINTAVTVTAVSETDGMRWAKIADGWVAEKYIDYDE